MEIGKIKSCTYYSFIIKNKAFIIFLLNYPINVNRLQNLKVLNN